MTFCSLKYLIGRSPQSFRTNFGSYLFLASVFTFSNQVKTVLSYVPHGCDGTGALTGDVRSYWSLGEGNAALVTWNVPKIISSPCLWTNISVAYKNISTSEWYSISSDQYNLPYIENQMTPANRKQYWTKLKHLEYCTWYEVRVGAQSGNITQYSSVVFTTRPYKENLASILNVTSSVKNSLLMVRWMNSKSVSCINDYEIRIRKRSDFQNDDLLESITIYDWKHREKYPNGIEPQLINKTIKGLEPCAEYILKISYRYDICTGKSGSRTCTFLNKEFKTIEFETESKNGSCKKNFAGTIAIIFTIIIVLAIIIILLVKFRGKWTCTANG